MIEREKQSLGMSCEQEAQEWQRQHDANDVHRHRRRPQVFHREHRDDRKPGDQAVIQSPDRKQEITLLALIPVTAPRAAIKRCKPVKCRARLPPWMKDRRDTAFRTAKL